MVTVAVVLLYPHHPDNKLCPHVWNFSAGQYHTVVRQWHPGLQPAELQLLCTHQGLQRGSGQLAVQMPHGFALHSAPYWAKRAWTTYCLGEGTLGPSRAAEQEHGWPFAVVILWNKTHGQWVPGSAWSTDPTDPQHSTRSFLPQPGNYNLPCSRCCSGSRDPLFWLLLLPRDLSGCSSTQWALCPKGIQCGGTTCSHPFPVFPVPGLAPCSAILCYSWWPHRPQWACCRASAKPANYVCLLTTTSSHSRAQSGLQYKWQMMHGNYNIARWVFLVVFLQRKSCASVIEYFNFLYNWLLYCQYGINMALNRRNADIFLILMHFLQGDYWLQNFYMCASYSYIACVLTFWWNFNTVTPFLSLFWQPFPKRCHWYWRGKHQPKAF